MDMSSCDFLAHDPPHWACRELLAYIRVCDENNYWCHGWRTKRDMMKFPRQIGTIGMLVNRSFVVCRFRVPDDSHVSPDNQVVFNRRDPSTKLLNTYCPMDFFAPRFGKMNP